MTTFTGKQSMVHFPKDEKSIIYSYIIYYNNWFYIYYFIIYYFKFIIYYFK